VTVGPVDPLALRVAARSESKSLGRLWRLVRSCLALVWSSGRRLLIALVAVQVLSAAALAAQVLTVQRVLSAILGADDERVMDQVLVPVIVLAALSAVAAVAGQGQLSRLLGESVARTMWAKVLGVATGVGLRYFESPEFYNRLQRVQTSAVLRPYQVTQGLLGMAGALAASIGLGLTLFAISPLLLPLVVVAGIPLLVTSPDSSSTSPSGRRPPCACVATSRCSRPDATRPRRSGPSASPAGWPGASTGCTPPTCATCAPTCCAGGC
jgi:ATP-binding cassette, subfamily B, bacterial